MCKDVDTSFSILEGNTACTDGVFELSTFLFIA